MEKVMELIIENFEIVTAMGAFSIVVIDYVVKKTKNKIDDAIWSKAKKPVTDMVKSYFENKKKTEVKTEDKEAK